MKCKHCQTEYPSGAHFCQKCGKMTAEGEMSLALSEFATAMKHLAKETARIGKTGLQKVEPGFKGAIEHVSKAGKTMAVAAKPAGEKAIVVATKAMRTAAEATEKAARELRKTVKGG